MKNRTSDMKINIFSSVYLISIRIYPKKCASLYLFH